MRRLLFIPFLAVLTASADTNLTAFVSVQNGKAVLSIQASNGIGNFRVIGSTVTATNPAPAAAASSEWVTSQTIGTLRSDFVGYVGLFLTNTSASAVSVTHLGRWVHSGNDDMHTLYLKELPGMSTVAYCTVTNTDGISGSYMWGAVTATLAAGTTYALLGTETNSGGDAFGDSDTAITVESSRGIAAGPACYSNYLGDTPTTNSVAGFSFGPLNLRCGE